MRDIEGCDRIPGQGVTMLVFGISDLKKQGREGGENGEMSEKEKEYE